MFNFYMNVDDSKDLSGAFSIQGLNQYNGQEMAIEGRSDQQVISTKGSNVAVFKFNKSFPNMCKSVKVTGKVIVTLGNGQILFFPVGIVLPQNITKDGFTITGPTYEYAEFVFQVAYEAIGW